MFFPGLEFLVLLVDGDEFLDHLVEILEVL